MGNCCFRAGAYEAEAAWNAGLREQRRNRSINSTRKPLECSSVSVDAIVGPSASSKAGKAFAESSSIFCSPEQQQIAEIAHTSSFGSKQQLCCRSLGSEKAAALSSLKAPGSTCSHASTDSSSHVSTAVVVQVGSGSNIPSFSSSSSSSRGSSDSGHTAFASVPASLCPSGSFRPDSMMTALRTTSSYSSSSSSYGGSCPRSKRTGGTLAAAEAATVAVAGEQQQQQNHVTCKEVGSPIQQHPVSNSPLAANRGTTEEVSDEAGRPPFWRHSGWSFGAHSEQNQRQYMEDRTVTVDLTGHEAFPAIHRAGLFSVFDGHGGFQVAEYLAEHVRGQLLSAGADAVASKPLRVLGDAVEDAERHLLASYAEGDTTAAAGSTLCAVLLLDDKLHVAHVGDSRAVLACGSTAKQLTRDHKPACDIEASRIKSDDPEAVITSDGYLYSELGVARAIGSAHLKRDPSKRALIATAEMTTVQLEQRDDFVIVATDGLWDSISSREAVSVARRVLSDTKDAGAASRALVERAQRCGSSDNISVVTLLLHGRPIVVPRSNSRLFKRPASHQLGAASTNDSPRST